MTNQHSSTGAPSSGLEGIGSRLSQAIAHLDINQSEFARRVGSSPGFVSDVVRGIKKPGLELIAGAKRVFGMSADWLLTGEGALFGGAGINLELLHEIRLQVAVAKAAIVGNDPVAKALLLLIREGQIDVAAADPTLRTYLDQLCPDDPDFNLVTELYNGHLWVSDPLTQHRNLLGAAIAHFEARKPVDKLASLAKSAGAAIQINVGRNQRNAARDYYE